MKDWIPLLKKLIWSGLVLIVIIIFFSLVKTSVIIPKLMKKIGGSKEIIR